MAEDPMTEDRLTAGADYLAALKALGFRPEAMLWVHHMMHQEMQLAIVSSLVDRVGPLDIYKVLFDAYDKAATPKSVDPFIVSLYSPEASFATSLKREMEAFETKGSVIGRTAAGGRVDLGEPWRVASDCSWRESWVYVRLGRKPEMERQMRQWSKFKNNVERWAA